MCRRDFTDDEADKIFDALRNRFPTEWDVDISWGQAVFDTESYFTVEISNAQLRAIIGSTCDCDDCQ